MSTLGEKLRDLRTQRNLTLKQVSDDIGLSLSFLSLVERDKVSISVDHLEQLARFYGIRMVSLFQGLQESTILVNRNADLRKVMDKTQPGHSNFALLSHRAAARMEPLLVRVGAGHGDHAFRTVEGDVLVYVLEGSLRLLSEKGETVELLAGDSAYYFGFPGHRIENASQKEPALILLVTSPPTTLRDDVLDGKRGILIQTEQ